MKKIKCLLWVLPRGDEICYPFVIRTIPDVPAPRFGVERCMMPRHEYLCGA
jgi:hypothetical protein